MQIHHEQRQGGGRYWLRRGRHPAAGLLYSWSPSGVFIIDHTGVPDVYAGQDVGALLIRHAIEAARMAGLKIMPLCPFAADQFRRHPEWHDVLA